MAAGLLISLVVVAPARAQTPVTYQPSGPICTLLSSVTPQGGTLTVTCQNFAANTPLTFTGLSTPTPLGNGTTDASGSITHVLNIPTNFPVGAHTLLVTGNARDGVPRTLALAFTVTGTTTGGLSRTGANVAKWGGLGVGLLALGGLLVLVARRRNAATRQ